MYLKTNYETEFIILFRITPVILAILEAEMGRIAVRPARANSS
jgi:hypothetical protein